MNTLHPKSTASGFTLIEVMIVVGVIGLLAAIALPNYSAYVMRSHRAEAKNYLQALAQRLEQNYSLAGSYNMTQSGTAINNTFISAAGMSQVPPGGSARYNISFVAGQPQAATYTLQAVPTGAQANDTCGILLLNEQSLKGAGNVLNNRATLTMDCWNR